MDDYYKIAYEYFQTFEGRQLYPKPVWWHLVAITMTLMGLWLAFTSGSVRNMHLQDWVMIASFLPLLVVVMSAADHRRERLRENALEAGADSVEDFKRLELTRLLGIPSTGFGETARQILELRQMHQNTRPSSDGILRNLWRLIYDKGSKDRLMTVALAGLSVILVLLDKSSTIDFPPMIDMLGADGFWQFLAYLLFFSVLLWLVVLAIASFVRTVIDDTTHLLSAIGWKGSRNPLPLNYLLNDLIRLHSATRRPQKPNSIITRTQTYEKAMTRGKIITRARRRIGRKRWF